VSVKVWWGERPQTGYEFDALESLAHALKSCDDSYSLLAFFKAGTHEDYNEIDLAIFVDQSACVVELKTSQNRPIHSTRNGPWRYGDGQQERYGGEKGNPAAQLKCEYRSFRNTLHKHRARYLRGNKPSLAARRQDWNKISTFLVFWPSLPAGSIIAKDDFDCFRRHWGDVLGWDEFLDQIKRKIWRRPLPIELTSEEIRTFAEEVLGLTHIRFTEHHEVDEISEPGESERTEPSMSVPPTSTPMLKVLDGNPLIGVLRRLLRAKRKLFSALAVLSAIGVVLGVILWPRPIEAPDAYKYIGRDREIKVRIEVGRIDRRDSDIIVYDARLDPGDPDNFSLEINGTPSLSFTEGSVILVGPTAIGTSESGLAQVELEPETLHQLLDVRRF